MLKLFSSSVAVLAGIVSAPVVYAPLHVMTNPPAGYREDTRGRALRTFFEKMDCPAREYIAEFLDAADSYRLDWRLLPSLAFVESGAGKSAPNNNLFGWDSGRAQFSSPIAGIHEVGFRLTHSPLYKDKDLDALLATYNPAAEYAQKVKSVMEQISPAE
jgi:flagellum-specific peptidoglycan hydrolase FlgJ